MKVIAIDGAGAFHAELTDSDVVELDVVLVRCTSPDCRTFQEVRIPADPSTELPCKRCSARVGAFADDDLQEVDQASPEYGQVRVQIDGEYFAITYRDFELAIFGLIRGAGRWHGHPFSRWVYDDPTIRSVRFTGARVCARCLYQRSNCEACTQ